MATEKKQLEQWLTGTTPWVKNPALVETVLFNFILTGKMAKDEQRIEQVRQLVEQFGGEFSFDYAHKANIYRFTIGGNFTSDNAAKFRAAFRAAHPIKAAGAGK